MKVPTIQFKTYIHPSFNVDVHDALGLSMDDLKLYLQGQTTHSYNCKTDHDRVSQPPILEDHLPGLNYFFKAQNVQNELDILYNNEAVI